MTVKEFKKIGRLLKELYKELERESLASGIDIFSDRYLELQNQIRRSLLAKMGFSEEEYIEARDRTINEQKAKRKAEIEQVNKDLDELYDRETLDEEDVLALINDNQKPPQITEKTINKIVKETTVEKPTIVKETKTVVEREEYDDKYLMAEIGYLNDRLDNLPEPKEVDLEEVKNLFGEMFEHNINTLDMPDWRKLAMGLQAQIDTKVQGVGINRLFVSDTEPENLVAGDFWLDTAAYSYQDLTANYTLTDTDYLVNCNGTFTVTLPTAVDFTGEYIIKNSGLGLITVGTTSSQTIDDSSTKLLQQYDSMVVRSDGANWIIV